MTDASPPTNRLHMQGVSKRFGATIALDGVDLDVRAGEVHALIGENGAGKSTLMKILAGAHAPDAGTMHLDGAPYRPRTPADGRGAGVSMIYQELSLAQHLSVMENICLGLEPGWGPFLRWGAIRGRAERALARIGRDDIPLDAPVSRLSIGEQQLVEVARSIAVGSRVLVLDEPTSSLPERDIRRLFELIRRLRADGHAIVYISHVLEEIREVGDRYTVLRDGQSVGSGAVDGAEIGDVVELMVGRRVEELYPRSARSPGAVALEVTDLGGTGLLRGATLRLHRGEVLGIAGLIGAGRTELLRAIFGLDPVVRGAVRVGTFTGPAAPGRRWAQGVGMVSEDRKREGLALGLSVAENVTIAGTACAGGLGFLTPRGQERDARPWIERLAIHCASPRQPVASLSGGNQQKVAIARLLHADVDVLLLDEPTRGIDVGSKAQIYRLIDAVTSGAAVGRGGTPKAVLLVSSYLPELLGVCDRVAVMSRGRLGPVREIADVDEHALMMEAIGAREAG